jgi:naphthoate synthase
MAAPVSELFDASLWHEVDGFTELVDVTYHHDIEGRVARIAFNRPEVRNAFRPQTVV